MRILFVENRYTTYLWDAVAKELVKEGHEIFWIVQNKEFIPTTGKIFKLKISNTNYKHKTKVYDNDIKKVIRADRGINYFGVKSDDHLFAVKEQIERILDKVKPQVGFGECTLHHEMLTMQALRKRNILYLFPTSSRYPLNRFCFYSYDTLFPFSGSNETIATKDALEIVKKIGARKLKPDYMSNAANHAPSIIKRTKDKIKIFKGYVRGERYNTPSVITKIQLKTLSKNNIQIWDSFAKNRIEKNGYFIILYPLHLQPEVSIDVWATEFNNQHEIIRQILKTTPENTKIVIKPNPASSMEIGEELINLAENNQRIIPLHHSVTMDQIVEQVDLVVTATGTIALESIFANRPVVTLVQSYFNEAHNCIYLNSYNHLKPIINNVEQNTFPKMTENEQIDFLNYLNKISFRGTISCTFWKDDITNHDNVKNLKKAFLSVIETIKNDTTGE